jgi:heat shock protein HtpX
MAVFKRVSFFLIVNILVMIVGSFFVNFILKALGIQGTTTGIYAFFFLYGMAGSMISLFISKWMAKKFMGVQIVEPGGQYGELVEMVHRMSRKAGLNKMPEVGIYHSEEINAFATGPSRNNSLVAVSTGLLNQMERPEVEGVIGHEVAHIANGDMVTMSLIQGIVNAFVMIFSWIVTNMINNFLRDEDGEGGLGFFAELIVRNVLNVVFGIMAMPIVMWFSRWREYRADVGGAQLAGKSQMIQALEALQRNYPQLQEASSGEQHEGIKTMQISSKASIMELFSSHPPLDKRIEALRRS